MKNTLIYLQTFLFAVCLFLTSILNLNAQTFTNFTSDDGLIDAAIYSIVEAENGEMWFGGWSNPGSTFINGLSRYEGGEFTTYSTNDGLIHDQVTGLLIDQNDHLWVATFYGLSQFDGTNWTSYTMNNGLIWDTLHSMFEDEDGNLWFAGRESNISTGISVYDGTNWTYHPDLGYEMIIQADDGSIWVGGENGIHHYDGGEWNTYTTADGLSTNDIYVIDFDDEGNLWAGNYSETLGIDKFDGTNWTSYSTADGLVNNRVRAIYKRSNGEMWFGTNGGIAVYDGTTWTSYTEEDGLLNNNVRSIYEDAEGNMWIGTFEGVSKMSFDPISSDNQTFQNKLKIYPNPTSSVLFIQNPETSIADIVIHNSIGQSMPISNAFEGRIDLSLFPNGIYWLTVTELSGKQTIQKVVKN